MTDFKGTQLWIADLLEITLPDYDIRICDGGMIKWGDKLFTASDENFGSVRAVDIGEERKGNEAPEGKLTYIPISTASAARLSRAEYQLAPFNLWMAEFDPETATVSGDPQLLFNGLVDQTELIITKNGRILEMSFISIANRLFRINEGNVMSDRFHQSIWPGQKGFANATGVPSKVAWGVEGPPRGVSGGGSGGGRRDPIGPVVLQ